MLKSRRSLCSRSGTRPKLRKESNRSRKGSAPQAEILDSSSRLKRVYNNVNDGKFFQSATTKPQTEAEKAQTSTESVSEVFRTKTVDAAQQTARSQLFGTCLSQGPLKQSGTGSVRNAASDSNFGRDFFYVSERQIRKCSRLAYVSPMLHGRLFDWFRWLQEC